MIIIIKENRLIPDTSCLWRQEEVTVAILFLSTQAWMSAARQYGYTNLQSGGFFFLAVIMSGKRFQTKHVTRRHFLPLCLRTFSVFVRTLCPHTRSCQRFYITAFQSLTLRHMLGQKGSVYCISYSSY